MRFSTVGDCMAVATSVLIFFSTSGGTFEAVIRANHVLLSKPVNPASTSVGTSGTFGSRFGPAAASTRSLPSLESGSVVDGDENIECTSEVTSARAAGIDPGYGTCTMLLMPEACMKRCIPRNGALPGPAEEKVSPGVDFANSINSFTVFAGSFGMYQQVVEFLPDKSDRLKVLDRTPAHRPLIA